MSATTELFILQAAPAPTGALALGVPASDAEYEAFSETLKAELKSGQASSENGKSLPRGGDNLPDGEAETQLTGATAAAGQKKATMPSADDQPSDANVVETVASETDALTSLGTARDASEPVSRADASGETALPPLWMRNLFRMCRLGPFNREP